MRLTIPDSAFAPQGYGCRHHAGGLPVSRVSPIPHMLKNAASFEKSQNIYNFAAIFLINNNGKRTV